MSTENMKYDELKEGLLDGLKGTRRELVEQFMDNTHSNNTSASVRMEQEKIFESTAAGSTTTGDITRYDQIFMPLIRRTMPNLLAMDLVGVQAIPGPRGVIRTLRKRYSEDTGSVVTAGDEASAQNLFQKYSLLQNGETDYDATDAMNPFEQTEYLEGNRGKPMSLDVTMKTVETKSRKLSARWSLEADDDLQNLDGLSMESELIATLSDEIRRELDRELMGELTRLAGSVRTLDFANVDGRYAGEKLSAMTIAFSDMSSDIALATKRSGATWMVVSPRVLTGMKNASNSTFVPAEQNAFRASETLFVGTFDGNISVYVDVHMEGDQVVMGRKGSEIDSPLIYSTYIPLSSSGIVVNPETLDKGMGLRTRYALTAFEDPETDLADSADHLARATIANLELGFSNATP